MDRPKKLPVLGTSEVEDGYRGVVLDIEREQEAEEWCEALIGDACETTDFPPLEPVSPARLKK